MEEETLDLIELNEKTDRIAARVKCPCCGDEYLYGVPYVQVPCRKCGITYKTDFKQDIYTKKSRQIEDKKTESDGLIVRTTEQYKKELIHIQYNHDQQKCWEVSDIKKLTEEYRYCMQCGVCHNCYTCKCGNTFQRDKRHRKQKCPACGESDFQKTYFKDAKAKGSLRVCPECDSDRIKLTRTTNKTKCHRCESKKLSDKKTNVIYELIIRRKKAYRK